LSPLKDLLAAIEREADEELSRLEAESRAEAEEILRSAREEAEVVRASILRPAQAEAQAEAYRRVARARLAAQNARRAVREEAFARLLAKARSELSEQRESGGYRATLDALLREALAALPEARIVHTDPRDKALVSVLVEDLGADLTVEPTLDTAGGVALETGDGRLLRNTFEERLANAEPQLRLLYGRRLQALAAEPVGASR